MDSVSMKIALALLVKTPGYSPLKTRLAADVGAARALEFYERSCKSLEWLSHEFVSRDPARRGAFWAVAEPEAMEDPRWERLPRIPQGSGGLGERLASVYTRLHGSFDAVVLLGADLPQLCTFDLEDAVAAMGQYRGFCSGPSRDGGFYLLAGNVPVPRESWTSVQYSREDTWASLKRELLRIGKVRELHPLSDGDTAADLLRIKEELGERALLLSQPQTELLQWMDS